ncbi:hypothetical protein AFV8_gp12 [Betalipothrixvirus puteoliense]|uniref:Uncharacterized protein n=1 Tax=Betalipothrixvirus puteoliense TaxID=346884 RepID=A7WKU2_9VIRU|nr:hypothetical protein AFV8_gp12 [Acidianus filamentous virus 8]CAJ31689.1 conserved hypothetical protein [Acidianus filamentous virus 8]
MLETKLSKGEERILIRLFDEKEINIRDGKIRRIVNSLTRKGLTEIKIIVDKEKSELTDFVVLTEKGEKIATILKLQEEIKKAYEIAVDLRYAYEIEKKEIDEIIKTINTLAELAQKIDEENEKKKAIRVIYVLTRRALKKIRIS